MQRTCEPELMDDGLQAAAYAAADFAAGDQAFADRIAAVLQHCGCSAGSSLVDLGCGPGNITFLMAERFPETRVLGIDGAAAMLQIARGRLAADRSRWPNLDFIHAVLGAEGLDRGSGPLAHEVPGGFTTLVSNSLLHHLHDPQVLWDALKRLAAPGAVVVVKDLRRPSSPEAVLALRDRHLALAPPVLQHDYVASLHAAFTAAEVWLQLQAAGLEGALQVAEVDDRYLEVWGRLP